MALLEKDELLAVIERLINSTKSGKLKWRPYQDRGEMEAETAKFVYYIKPRDDDDAPPYQFQVYAEGNRGMVLEVISSRDELELQNAMSTLYSSSKLSALGIGSLKDEIFNDLTELDSE
ncbi:hypothetical protein [Herbiconiux sp. A18JL235]|uniref:Uncharacterized protein n=1 Tax=Herbiconiux sp. A18JL235 TaxID=3152363 RepID=A0AB39BMC6_9MICO